MSDAVSSTWILGRGGPYEDDSAPRITFVRQRPNRSSIDGGPLTVKELSRTQLRIDVTRDGLDVTNVGLAVLSLDGRPVDVRVKCSIVPGTIVTLSEHYLFVFVMRPAELAGVDVDVAPHDFGQPDGARARSRVTQSMKRVSDMTTRRPHTVGRNSAAVMGTAVLIVWLASCGGSVAGDAAPPADAGSIEDASSSGRDTSDSSAECALGQGASVADSAPSAFLDFTRVSQGTADDPITPTMWEMFEGNFYASPVEVPDRTCCRTIGGCVACASPCDLDAAVPQAMSAGILTLSGSSFAPVSIPFVADGGGGYYGSNSVPAEGQQIPAFNGGDTVCISGSGGYAPPFPTLPIVVPSFLTLTAPAIPPVSPLTVSTAQDLVLTWAAGPSDVTVVAYFTYEYVGPFPFYPYLFCSFDSSTCAYRPIMNA